MSALEVYVAVSLSDLWPLLSLNNIRVSGVVVFIKSYHRSVQPVAATNCHTVQFVVSGCPYRVSWSLRCFTFCIMSSNTHSKSGYHNP
jgi:hypothetical protein